jgi:hypothetical protein
LTFNPGVTTRQVTVVVAHDTRDEDAETFQLTLSNAVNGTLGDAVGVGTVNDNDAAPSMVINNVSVTEGASAAVNATFTVTLSAQSGKTVTVNYATQNATATAPSDYTAATGTLTFTPGTTTRQITVVVAHDTADEPTEQYTVGLSGAANATINDAQGVGTINDNDPAPSLAIGNVSVIEGDSGTRLATFTVTLSAASGRTVTVNFATANGSASSSSDYVAQSGSLSFTPGTTTRTISVTVRGDNSRESNETFNVNLSNASNASIADSQGVGTILNDD